MPRWLIITLLGAALIIVLGYVLWRNAFLPQALQTAIDNAASGINEKIDETIAMVSLNTEQEGYISQLNPAVQDVFRSLIAKVQSDTDWDIIPTDAYRTIQESVRLKSENPKNATPGDSAHNWGLALDINARNRVNGSYLRKESSSEDWINSGIVAIADGLNLRWGGRFNGYKDNVHFDAYNLYPLASVKAAAIEQYGSINNAIGNEVNLT